MSTPSPAPVAARTAPSTSTRILIGCAVALGLALLVAGGLAAWGFYWMVTPGRQVPTLVAVAPGSTGVVRCGNLAGDAGVRAFLATFIGETQKGNQAGPMPEWMRGFMGPMHAESLRQWLPTEGTLSFEQDPADGQVHPVAALNFSTHVRLARLMLENMARDPEVATSVQHRGETILAFNKGPALSFVGGTLLLSDTVERLRPAIDRALDTAAPSPAVPPDLRDLEGTWDAHGAVTGAEAAQSVGVLMMEPIEDETVAAPSAARFGVDFQTKDALRGFLELSYADADEAAAALDAVTIALDQRTRRLQATGAQVRATPRQDGARIVVDLESAGLAAALGRSVAVRAQERPPTR
jgi:hypothetical protein